VPGQHDPLVLGFGHAAVRDQTAGIQLDLDPVLVSRTFHAAADPVHRDRVAVGVQRDVAFHVHQPLMEPVDFGNPGRQRPQMQALQGE